LPSWPPSAGPDPVVIVSLTIGHLKAEQETDLARAVVMAYDLEVQLRA